MLISNGPPTGTQLVQRGAVMQVQVGAPLAVRQALQAAGKPVPQPQVLSALIDTGATVCGVSYTVLQALGVQPTRTIAISGVSGPNPHGVFVVDFNVPLGAQSLKSANREVVGFNLGAPYQALIGHDFLAGMMLVYHGPTGTWTLAF